MRRVLEQAGIAGEFVGGRRSSGGWWSAASRPAHTGWSGTIAAQNLQDDAFAAARSGRASAGSR
ncbi:MAG TPA: hypothetical protein VJ010_02520 [Actinomycetota bacterium]|nr:hypothetical protein [Actinomycetota bacterium]